MFIIIGIVTGIIATVLFDIFQISISYAYKVNKTKWNLVGRYFIGLKNHKLFVENIESENSIKNELFIGYFIHYSVGAIYGLIYVIINLLFFDHPSLFLAIFIGFMTVLGAWCYMMPYAYNTGFFASKKEDQFQIMVQNLITHFIFGIGLYIGLLLQS